MQNNDADKVKLAKKPIDILKKLSWRDAIQDIIRFFGVPHLNIERNHNAVNFFLNSPNAYFRSVRNRDVRSLVGAFRGRNDEAGLLQQIYANRDRARADYNNLRGEFNPQDITDQQMAGNIGEHFAPKVNEIIEYSRLAINTLNLPPKEVFSQAFDKETYNQERTKRYAAVGVEALLPNLSQDITKKIGHFLELNDVKQMARVNQDTRIVLEAEFQRLDYNH